MNPSLEQLLDKVNRLVDRIDAVLPQPLGAPDWAQAVAWRYRKRASGHGVLEPVRHVAAMTLADLQEIDDQKERMQRNIRLRAIGELDRLPASMSLTAMILSRLPRGRLDMTLPDGRLANSQSLGPWSSRPVPSAIHRSEAMRTRSSNAGSIRCFSTR